MKKLILSFVSILIFSFIFFTACGESSNPTGPVEKINKFAYANLLVDVGYYNHYGNNVPNKALIVGTNLGKSRGKYFFQVHWQQPDNEHFKTIYCNDPDLKITVQDPSILKFDGCNVLGLKTGATKVTFEYPQKGNREGFKLEYDAWCIKHSVEGEWDLYHSNDSLSWSFYKTTYLYDVPERKITMAIEPVAESGALFKTPSDDILDYGGNQAKFIDKDTIIKQISASMWSKYVRK